MVVKKIFAIFVLSLFCLFVINEKLVYSFEVRAEKSHYELNDFYATSLVQNIQKNIVFLLFKRATFHFCRVKRKGQSIFLNSKKLFGINRQYRLPFAQAPPAPLVRL